MKKVVSINTYQLVLNEEKWAKHQLTENFVLLKNNAIKMGNYNLNSFIASEKEAFYEIQETFPKLLELKFIVPCFDVLKVSEEGIIGYFQKTEDELLPLFQLKFENTLVKETDLCISSLEENTPVYKAIQNILSVTLNKLETKRKDSL